MNHWAFLLVSLALLVTCIWIFRKKCCSCCCKGHFPKLHPNCLLRCGWQQKRTNDIELGNIEGGGGGGNNNGGADEVRIVTAAATAATTEAAITTTSTAAATTTATSSADKKTKSGLVNLNAKWDASSSDDE